MHSATLGSDWLAEQISLMTDRIERLDPVTYNERTRYIPNGASPEPGYIRFDRFPFLREPLMCFAQESTVREVNFQKGVQVGYTTLLESVLLYYIGHVRTMPGMFVTADDGLSKGRMENNILPMLHESELFENIRSADVGNTRKTGKTKDFLQWKGGGYLIYNGANNAAKMRQYSVQFMLKDEIDGWPEIVGKDGNPDALTDDRLSAYWAVRKILRGSTPLLHPSMISTAYNDGDQRKYLVLCRGCSFPQELRMEVVNSKTGLVGGFHWETENDVLILESVHYVCPNCGHPHWEHDKEALFSTEQGAHWSPTAPPKEPGIRSYHLPAFYSPVNFRPWSKNISDYLACYDVKQKKVTDIGRYQRFYNNVLGMPFRQPGAKVRFESVSAHRRMQYRFGEVPNAYAVEHSGSEILFLTCVVDVHKGNLAVAVFGWCKGARVYLIDYWRFEPKPDTMPDCRDISATVWQDVRDLIEDKVYIADNGRQYRILLTFIDSNGPANANVLSFCSEYAAGVFPILGRSRQNGNSRMAEFAKFPAQDGSSGWAINVDHYKDRMASALRRQWIEGQGPQDQYHFNAPLDTTDDQLKELTKEELRKKTDARGREYHEWHRLGSTAQNELWDNLGYGYAGVEILARDIVIEQHEKEEINWVEFWEYVADPENDIEFARIPA